MNKKLILPLILIVFSLLVGCSEKKVDTVDTNEIDTSNREENQNSMEIYNGTLIESEYCDIKATRIDIVDNNAEFTVYIENKSDNDIEVMLNEVNLGIAVKEAEFEYKVKPRETKKGILKVKEIPKLETLNDKLEGEFLISSDIDSYKSYFVFK